MSQRLYSQYQPTADSLKYVLGLQAQAAAANPSARAVPNSQIHLTIIHYGSIDEVFQQLEAVAPQLHYTTYRLAITDFVRAVSRALPARVDAQLQSWQLFGEAGRTLVLSFEPNQALLQAHTASLQALERCFADCGVSHPARFMADNQNFQYALTLKPHITLLKNAMKLPRETLEPKMLHLQAMPILYD